MQCPAGVNMSGPSACDMVDYRRGRCGECNCCPSCWTCVELLSAHYDCAQKQRSCSQHFKAYWVLLCGAGSVMVNVKVNARFPRSGWLRSACTSFQGLQRAGLRFHDDGSIEGTVTPEAEEQIWFTAFHTSHGTVIQLNLHLYVQPSSSLKRRFEYVDPRVVTAGNVALASYRDWERRKSPMQRQYEE